jgi:hypothetical protein
MANLSAIAYAAQTLTSNGTDVTAADTVTIGTVVYTFRASVTTTANEVKVGGTAAASLDNLKAAINASDPTVHGSLTVANPYVEATTNTDTTQVVVAKVPGLVGNYIPTTKSAATLTWGTTVLAGGTGSVYVALQEIITQCQLNADVLQALDVINSSVRQTV